MVEKIIFGWIKSIHVFSKWCAERVSFVATLMYPAIAVFYILWVVFGLVLVTSILLLAIISLPFNGILGFGSDVKDLCQEVFDVFEEVLDMYNDEEEPEEEPEEMVEEPVEVYTKSDES